MSASSSLMNARLPGKILVGASIYFGSMYVFWCLNFMRIKFFIREKLIFVKFGYSNEAAEFFLVAVISSLLMKIAIDFFWPPRRDFHVGGKEIAVFFARMLFYVLIFLITLHLILLKIEGFFTYTYHDLGYLMVVSFVLSGVVRPVVDFVVSIKLLALSQK